MARRRRWLAAALGLDLHRGPAGGRALARLGLRGVSLALCAYITVRYEALTYELAMLPLEGIVGSAILTFLVLEASRRISGWGFVGIILAIAVYVYISPFWPAISRPAGSPPSAWSPTSAST